MAGNLVVAEGQRRAPEKLVVELKESFAALRRGTEVSVVSRDGSKKLSDGTVVALGDLLVTGPDLEPND